MRVTIVAVLFAAIGCGEGDGGERADGAGLDGADGPDCRWHVEIIDPEPIGVRLSLATDAAGELHAAYVHDPSRVLHYARRAAGVWFVERVDATSRAGDAAVAVDAAGRAHVVYGDLASPPSVAMRHAVRDPEGWSATAPLAGTVNTSEQSLAFDPAGVAHVAYSAGSVRHARRGEEDGEWIVTTIDAGARSRLAIDAAGRVHVAYLGSRMDGDGAVWILGHAVLDGDAWSTTVVDTQAQLGSTLAIAAGPGDVVHIAYIDLANRSLKHAAYRGGWTVETVPAFGRPISPAIALDGSGRVHILYTDGDAGGIHHARVRGDTWTSSRIDDFVDVAQASRSVLATDATGELHALVAVPAPQGATVAATILGYARPTCAD